MAFKQVMTLEIDQKSRDVDRCLLRGRVKLSHDLSDNFFLTLPLGRKFPDSGTYGASTIVHAGRQVQKHDFFARVLKEDMAA